MGRFQMLKSVKNEFNLTYGIQDKIESSGTKQQCSNSISAVQKQNLFFVSFGNSQNRGKSRNRGQFSGHQLVRCCEILLYVY